jgi:predicted nucleic acid-binding Zn ribbon protein
MFVCWLWSGGPAVASDADRTVSHLGPACLQRSLQSSRQQLQNMHTKKIPSVTFIIFMVFNVDIVEF